MARPGHIVHMFTCAIGMRFSVPCSEGDAKELNYSTDDSQARGIAKSVTFLTNGLTSSHELYVCCLGVMS